MAGNVSRLLSDDTGVSVWGFPVVLGLGYIGVMEKKNGNYYNIVGLY